MNLALRLTQFAAGLLETGDDFVQLLLQLLQTGVRLRALLREEHARAKYQQDGHVLHESPPACSEVVRRYGITCTQNFQEGLWSSSKQIGPELGGGV
jgi:hypothetical protein